MKKMIYSATLIIAANSANSLVAFTADQKENYVKLTFENFLREAGYSAFEDIWEIRKVVENSIQKNNSIKEINECIITALSDYVVQKSFVYALWNTGDEKTAQAIAQQVNEIINDQRTKTMNFKDYLFLLGNSLKQEVKILCKDYQETKLN